MHPSHFYYFSRATMTRLLARAGLEPLCYTTTFHWRSVKNIANQIGATARSERLRKSLFRLRDLALGRLQLPMNLHGIMFLIARKQRAEGPDVAPA